eukprot:5403157-Pleurochrysis_carterae.AAC.1
MLRTLSAQASKMRMGGGERERPVTGLCPIRTYVHGGCLRVSCRRVSGDSPHMLRTWVWAASRPATGATGV